MAARRIKLRRPGTCASCGAELAAGVDACWDAASRRVTCLPCLEGVAPPKEGDPDVPPIDSGTPGGSLGRIANRRRANRERRVRKAHPWIGGFLLAWHGEPQHEKAFRQGEQGEIAVAAAVERAVEAVDGIVLHNRRMPGGRRDIDHIAIVPSGIYVIDAKAVHGKVRSRWFKPPLLFIAGRDRTTYLDGLDRQTQAIRDVLDDMEPGLIQGVLCFTQADLPFLRTIKMRGHLLLHCKPLAKRLTASGLLLSDRRSALAATLAAALPAA